MNSQNSAVMANRCADGMKSCDGRCIPEKAMCHSDAKQKKGGLNAGHAALAAGALGAGAVAYRNKAAIGDAAKSVADNYKKNRTIDKANAARGALTKHYMATGDVEKVGKITTRSAQSLAGKKSTGSALVDAAKNIGGSIASNAKKDVKKVFAKDKK